MKYELGFELAKVTKGAIQYKEVSLNGAPYDSNARPDDMLVGTLYLRKSQVEGQPKEIKVTVEVP